MPNLNSTRSSSISSPCPTSGYDYILNESDTILNDLNEMIDSEVNRKMKINKKNDSYKINQLKDTLRNSEAEIKMPKLKSYVIKSSLSQLSGLGTESNASKIFHSNSNSININPNYAHHATVSGAKLSKKLVNTHLMPYSPTSSNLNHKQQHRDHASSATCIINNSKKKRSSLFNLFSFKNLSRDSSISNSQTSIQNSKSVNQSVTNLTSTKNNKSKTNENSEKYEKKKFNEFHFISLEPQKQAENNTANTNDEDTMLETSYLQSSPPPPPEEFADECASNFGKKALSCRFRPHSVSVSLGDSTSKSSKTKPTSTSPDWHKSFRFLLSKKSSPKLSKSSKKLNDSNIESETASMSSFNLKANERDVSVNSSTANQQQDQSLKENTGLSKRPSIRSKGFSIPLNASFCLNPMPVNFRHNRDLSSSSITATTTAEILNLTCNEENTHVDNLYSIRNKLQQQYLYQQHLNKLDLNIENIYNNNNLDMTLNESAQMYNAACDESILFPINTFDLKEANSCLKEVNLRLKFAQINNIEDEFSDEVLQNGTNNIILGEEDDEECCSSSLSPSSSSPSSTNCSPKTLHKDTSFFDEKEFLPQPKSNQSQIEIQDSQVNTTFIFLSQILKYFYLPKRLLRIN
jgi:hypothetical protein